MLDAKWCQDRRHRFLETLDFASSGHEYVRLTDPIHLNYLANFHVEPISLNAGSNAVLILRKDGHTQLIHDDRQASYAALAHADEKTCVPWYDGQSPGRGPRQAVLVPQMNLSGADSRITDHPGDRHGARVIELLADMRRSKDEDELRILNHCMRAAEAGHAWSRKNVQAGMSELEVYTGIVQACTLAAGRAVIVYGDFAVSPGPERRGGPATKQILNNGDMLILDYSVVIHGYRCDFTNTLVVGRQPNAEQQRLYELCRKAMAAGEGELRAGASCEAVYEAVRQIFADAKVAEAFPHHAGHGLGLTHPEAPYFVRGTQERLREGDVVTLEPGLYLSGVGGIRIEHNYRVTEKGFETLSQHEITLV
jgi:Xaa-Pro aminopeptidase